jgi:hypothetical protein
MKKTVSLLPLTRILLLPFAAILVGCNSSGGGTATESKPPPDSRMVMQALPPNMPPEQRAKIEQSMKNAGTPNAGSAAPR